MDYTDKQLAGCIDHTLLKPEAREQDVAELCREARENGFAAVCVHPCYVPLCSRELQGSTVKVATVVGFPLGANTTETKAREAREALAFGAREIDMVLNIGFLKDKKMELVRRDIKAVVEEAQAFPGAVVKVIIETCLLTEEEKIAACREVIAAGADYVKTSTGFGSGGAAAEDVELLARVAGGAVKIKAAGGIKTREQAVKMLAAGASRLGTSSGMSIIKSGSAQM